MAVSEPRCPLQPWCMLLAGHVGHCCTDAFLIRDAQGEESTNVMLALAQATDEELIDEITRRMNARR